MAFAHSSPLNVLVAIGNAVISKQIINLLREGGNTSITEAEDEAHSLLNLRHGTSRTNLVICDELGGSGHLAILKFLRWNQSHLPASLPVICVAAQWTSEDLIAARDAGATSLVSMPLTKRTLEMAVAAAISPTKEFVTSQTFRGIDRRVASIKGYKGPFRRADDANFVRTAGSPLIAPAASMSEPIQTPHPSGDSVAPSGGRRHRANMEWSIAIATGNHEIDDQHQQIIDFLKILNDLAADGDAGDNIDTALRELVGSLEEHCIHEETLMDSFDYDQADEHKSIHLNFIKGIRSYSYDRMAGTAQLSKMISSVYGWLVSHITGIDRVMVAKMNGEYNDAYGNDTRANQTAIVIKSAYASATQIRQMSAHLKTARGRDRQAKLRRELSLTTERLINLMSLADSRVEISGCTSFQLRRLKDIREAVTSHADALAEVVASGIIEYGGKILSGDYGIPLGVGTTIGRKMERLFALIGVIGGLKAMSESTKAATLRAREIANVILDKDAMSAIMLPELGG